MRSLNAIRADAQMSANREGRPMVILNLNRAGAALYVVRSYAAGIESDRAYVETVQPQTGEA